LLAAAGLDRLEKTEWIRERLDPADFCPAAGQGSLGIETRKNDEATISAVAFLDDPATRFAVTAERAALAALGGGCQVPIGIHCRPGTEAIVEADEAIWEIFGVIADPETGKAARAYHSVPRTDKDAVAFGQAVANMLSEQAVSETPGMPSNADGAER
jgi:hydroxymethylbilane synthase